MTQPNSNLPMKILLSLMMFVASVSIGGAGVEPSAREGIEWCDIWIAHANETNLPRVLLIGDSIARGYHPAVEKQLAGKAYVARLTTSAYLTDPMLNQQIASVLDNVRFDVIHFNNGLHGWQHSEETYRKAFPGFVATIRKHAPKAKLIWATTTPFRPTAGNGDSNAAKSERVQARNAIALDVVRKKKIPVDDLFTLMRGHPELHSDDVHFNRDGTALQGEQVARHIAKFLPP